MGQPVGVARIDRRIVPCSDATTNVFLYRSEEDIAVAKRGNVRECADAQCVMREREKLPHKVLGVIVYASRAYIVDKLGRDGEPAHVVRYTRSDDDRADIDAFDHYGPEAIGPRTIVLYRPTESNQAGAYRRKGKMPSKYPGTRRHRQVLRGIARQGAVRRFLAANGDIVAL